MNKIEIILPTCFSTDNKGGAGAFLRQWSGDQAIIEGQHRDIQPCMHTIILSYQHSLQSCPPPVPVNPMLYQAHQAEHLYTSS